MIIARKEKVKMIRTLPEIQIECQLKHTAWPWRRVKGTSTMYLSHKLLDYIVIPLSYKSKKFVAIHLNQKTCIKASMPV